MKKRDNFLQPEIKIWDETLRDGEQMPGVVFSLEEKIELAKKSSEFGCDIISTMPATCKAEQELTYELCNLGLKSEISALTMLTEDSINLAKACRVDRVLLFTSVSDIHLKYKLKLTEEENLKKSLKFIDYAKELGLKIDFGVEDATRADINYLIEFINTMSSNIDYFLPADTLGCLTPFQTYDFIKKLKQETDCKIGLHVHNDFGQATANTLTGLCAGADLFMGTFNGIGERAGNAPIEEVIIALKYQYNKNLNLDYKKIKEICNKIEKYSGIKLQEHKPISGVNAFRHESGIHTSALLKDRRTYENFNPEEVGAKREFLFGKHSGRNSLVYLFENNFTKDEVSDILLDIKQKSIREKRAFTGEEVRNLYLTRV